MSSGEQAIADELAPEHLTDVLRGAGHHVTVDSVEAVAIGTGQMAGSYRLTLTYAGDVAGDVRGGDPLPTSMVAKVPVGSEERRAISANSYRLEVDFYRNIAPLLDARIPRCYGATRNDGGDDFLLLLEDLAPRRVGDQLSGCSVEQAEIAVENLAGVHGPVWGGEALVGLIDPLGQDTIDGTNAVFPMMTEIFLGRYGDRLSAGAKDVFERFAPLAGTFLERQRDVDGLVHGDYRLDNLLFAEDLSDVAVVDWQTVGLGLPGRDLAFFIATSFDPERRREVEDELVDRYHAALVQRGVEEYGRELCRTDYAYGMMQVPLTVVFGSAIAEDTERGDLMFLAMAERSAAAMVDLGTLDLVG